MFFLFRIVTGGIGNGWRVTLHAAAGGAYIWNVSFQYHTKGVKVFLLLVTDAVEEILKFFIMGRLLIEALFVYA